MKITVVGKPEVPFVARFPRVILLGKAKWRVVHRAAETVAVPIAKLGRLVLLLVAVVAVIATTGVLLFFPTVSHGEDIYIGQTSNGADTGTDCPNGHLPVWFNRSGNWANPKRPGRIGPGDTVHLCGTIGDELTAHAGGTRGRPIVILFEKDAKISMAASSTANGCLNISKLSDVIINGGANGIVENTANGTGLAKRSSSIGILATKCNSCEIRNLTIRNMYVHNSPGDAQIDQTQSNAVRFSGSDWLIHHNTIHDVGWALFDVYGNDSNVSIYGNNVYNCDHGIVLGGWGSVVATNISIHGNHIHDYANWDTASNSYHHDGIHAYATPPAKITGKLWIYGNQLDGAVGNNVTAHIFLEGGAGVGATPWTDATGAAYIFNNLLIADSVIYNGLLGLYAGNGNAVFNNTIIGAGPAEGVCLRFGRVATNVTVKNNVISGCNQLLTAFYDSPVSMNSDHNLFASCSPSYNCFWVGATATGKFSTYRIGQPDQDVHSIDRTSSTAGLAPSGIPTANSPVLRRGENLTVLGIKSLNSDKAGTPRPAKGPWDIGAYGLTGKPGMTSEACCQEQ